MDPLRWQSRHFSCRIGAMSFANVTGTSAAMEETGSAKRTPIRTNPVFLMTHSSAWLSVYPAQNKVSNGRQPEIYFHCGLHGYRFAVAHAGFQSPLLQTLHSFLVQPLAQPFRQADFCRISLSIDHQGQDDVSRQFG